MSKQKSDNVMLVPGETGWEIWSGSAGSGFTLISTAPTARAAEVGNIPSGDLTMLFPAKAFTALPMRVNTHDESLFSEMAAMHSERLGLRPDPMAGHLTDQFVVAREGDNTALLSVVLRTPGEGEMPPKAPKEFDLSARAIPYHGDSLVLWREFGRWVFAVSAGGKLVYCQATVLDSDAADAALVREIRLAMIQLSMQGLHCQPSRVVVYSSGAPDVSALVAAFGGVVDVLPKPAPVLPQPPSKLLPADVRAARREAQRKQQILAAVALVVIAYVAVGGWFGYKYWEKNRLVARYKAAAEEVTPLRVAYQQHLVKWDELKPVVSIDKAPVDLMARVAKAIPRTGNIRLTWVEIDGSEIKVKGFAPDVKPIKEFDLALVKSNELAGYTWENQNPTKSPKGWDFLFTGRSPDAAGPKP